MPWDARTLPTDYDELAPDGSEIRFLTRVAGASMVHCALAAGQATQAVRHRTVEEMWFCLAGAAQVWRRSDTEELTTDFRPGMAVNIPLGTDFQFRVVGSERLEFVIATAPPWPGADEAFAVEGKWPAGAQEPSS
jgi:mannose-6-phosphate isomerase-like protein (cupin superfamily)